MEKLRQYTSTTTAFIAALLVAVIFLFLFFYLGINQRKFSYEDSKQIAKEVSRKAAAETEAYFTSSLMIARSMVQRALIYQKLGADRQEIVNMLKTAVVRNPNFLGAWTMWEHNTYDGKDNFYRKNEYYDTLGNLSVTFFRHNDSILLEETHPADYFQDYYTIPKATRSELIIEPYFYQYQGFSYNYYESSVVIPIFKDSVFLGVFGIDINLDSLQRNLNKVRLYKTGFLSLISSKGIIVSHINSTYITKNFFEIIGKSDSLLIAAINNGLEYSLETTSEFSEQEVFRFFYPIKIGQNNNFWTMMVEIPIRNATYRSRQLIFVAVGILILGLCIILFLALNILDRKRYEKTIANALLEIEENNRVALENSQKYQEIFNSTSEAFFIHDFQTGEIVDVNDSMLKMYGYESKNEILNKTIDYFSANYKPYTKYEATQKIVKAFKEGIQVFEWLAKRKDGTLFWIEVSLRSSNIGGVKRILAVVRDISERKKVEKELSESQEKYKTLVDTSHDGISLMDLTGVMRFVNKRKAEMIRAQNPNELIGRNAFELLTPKSKNEIMALMPRIIDQGFMENLEAEVQRLDGTTFNAEFNITIIKDSDGSPSHIMDTMRDITERKNAIRAIEQSEKKFRELSELLPQIVWEANLDGTFTYTNKKGFDLFGFEQADFEKGVRIFDILAPEERIHALEKIKTLLQGNTSSNGTVYKALRKDGTTFPIEIYSSIVYSDGIPVGLRGVTLDISERVNADRALRESEKKYRTLIENINEVFMMVDNDDRILFVNHKFTEILGYEPDEVIGKIGYELLLAENDKIKIINANKDRLSNVVSQYEATFISKNGQKVEFLVSGAPILNNEGKTLGSIGAMMDITDRKKAERKLRESQQLFETLALMSPVGIFRTRADGYTNYVNPKWCELSGLTYSEALGDGWLKAVHPDDREKILNGWREKTQQSEKSVAEYRFVRDDGSVVWVLGNALPEIVDGELKGYIGTITNITEIKKAQEEIEKSEKKFREMANLLPQTIWEADINGKITFTNNNGYKYLGYTQDDFDKGIYMLNLIIPEDRARAIKNITQRYSNERSLGEEYTALRKDGTTYPVQIFTSPIFENDKPVGIRGISIDITESKKAQQELKESEERYRTIIEAFPDIIMISDLNGT